MFSRRNVKNFTLRIDALLILIGGLIATLGEILNLWNTDPTTHGWFFTTGLVVFGVVVLIYGINLSTRASDTRNIAGLLGTGLLFLCGLLTIVGTIAINMVVVPMLLGLAANVAAIVNAPGVAAEGATNTVSSGLNTVKNGIAGIFGQSGGPNIPSVSVPRVKGMDIVDKALAGLHLPSFAGISQWGHFFFTGGVLAIGCLILGLALTQTKWFPRTVSMALVIIAALNLLSQIPSPLPFIVANLTGILLFATLTWVGVSLPETEKSNRLSLHLPSLSNEKRTRILG